MRARELVAENISASRRLQYSKLAGEVLGVGRDAGVAVDHGLRNPLISTLSNDFNKLEILLKH